MPSDSELSIYSAVAVSAALQAGAHGVLDAAHTCSQAAPEKQGGLHRWACVHQLVRAGSLIKASFGQPKHVEFKGEGRPLSSFLHHASACGRHSAFHCMQARWTS